MNLKRCIFTLCVAFGVTLCSAALAATWPQIESRLATWDGAKEVQLPAGIDPLEDPHFAPVVEMLLSEGYAVHTAEQKNATDGLILKQHEGDSGTRLILSRARDGALLALEPLESPSSNETDRAQSAEARVLSTASVSRAPAETLRIESTPRAKTMKVGSAAPPVAGGEVLVDMPGTPRSIATWAAPKADAREFHLFALYDARLVHFCYRSGNLEQIAEFTPPTRVSRALRLECSDLDGDGVPELAPVWVEDVYSVDEGTESHLHSWVVEVDSDGSLAARSADLEGYLALVEEQLYLQERGEYSAFTSEVYEVEYGGETYRRSATPVAEAQQWVLNHARWPDNKRVLIWNDDQRLVLAARASGSKEDGLYSTGTLLSDFGTYVGARIYIPLEEPEYRSGFSAHDKVMARKVDVPRRLHPHGDALYTLARGREAGMPLVGKPSGGDKLVQINAVNTGLQAHFPFAPVDAFILDFDLIETPDGDLGAILLLNEKEDGTGKAYLQVQ